MNKEVLYTLAGLAMSFAGFSGVVVVVPTRGRTTSSLAGVVDTQTGAV